MDGQAKEPRGSECHPVTGWIGLNGLTGNGADFEGSRNRENTRGKPEWHEMLDDATSIEQIGQPKVRHEYRGGPRLRCHICNHASTNSRADAVEGSRSIQER